MIEKIKEKWDEILLHIKEEHELTDVSFKTWLLPTQPYSMKDGTLQILVPDVQFLGYIKKKYGLLIQITIEELTGIECEVDFVTIEQVDEPQKETDKSHLINRPSEVSRQLIQDANLNPRYTFDTFVVGANNNLAHAASLAVAESPGEIYNPLFIYGGVGLGKTHLMHSIGHFILKNNPKAKVLYVTSEKFTNELIDAIRNKNNISTTEFRENTETTTSSSSMISSLLSVRNRHRKNFSIPSTHSMKRKNRSLSPQISRRKRSRRWKNGFVPVSNGA